MQSAFAFPGTHTSDGVSYGSGCTANRSASMDSDISSWSPVPKRHCFYSLQPLSNCVSAHSDSEQGQQLGPALQQPATADASTTANVDRATALRALLSQRSPEEAEALLTYLHRLQRLRQAAASQHSQAQLLHQSFPQTVKQSAQKASASTLIKLQAAFHHVMQSQHTHQASSKLHQHMVDSDATDSIHPSADSFLSQLQEIQTPLQHHEDHSSVISYPQGEAVFWRSNRHAPSDADTAVYEAVQPQAEVFQSAYQSAYQYSQPCQRACQSDCMWQSASSCTQTASTACEQYSSQAPDAHVANHLLQLQQQARVVQQLAQEKRRLLMQQHVAREQQAFLERQVALPPVRPALSFPELVAYWAKGLSLQRCESVYLACHLWTRVQQQVSYPLFLLLETCDFLLNCICLAVSGCVWIVIICSHTMRI